MTFILYTLFFLSSIFLVLIILLQEGKGGGIADAFGGAGAQTFGVRAGGVNKVTMILFGIFLLCAVFLNRMGDDANKGSLIQDDLGNAPAATGDPAAPGTGSTSTNPAPPPANQ